MLPAGRLKEYFINLASSLEDEGEIQISDIFRDVPDDLSTLRSVTAPAAAGGTSAAADGLNTFNFGIASPRNWGSVGFASAG